MDVSQSFKHASIKQGINYFFCSDACFKKFEANPSEFQLKVGEPIEIQSGAYWVGSSDATEKVSFNSYLIVGKHVALIYDSISRLRDETMGKVGKLVDVEKIDYLIPTHYFFGQCCAFAGVAKMACNSEVVTSEATTKLKTLAHMKMDPNLARSVPGSKQEIIDLGDRKLRVFSNRLSGTPGSIFIYDDKSKILFSGEFLSNPRYEWDSKESTDGLGASIGDYQALRNPWIRLASKERLKEEISQLARLKIDIVAPSEGTIIRSGIDRCFEAYLDICDERSLVTNQC